MQHFVMAVLAFASFCSVSSYGPPATKNRHRTTTTTEAPAPSPSDISGPADNSVYSTSNAAAQAGSGSYSFSSSSPPNSVGGAGGGYWWQGSNSPFNPQQPLPAVPPHSSGSSNTPSHSGTPPTSSGSPIGAPSSQGSPIGSPPGQGSPSGSYPGQGSPSGSYPGQGSPSGSYPGQGSPSGSYPGQGSPSGSYPGQGSPSGSYPGQGSPSGSYPGQGSPSGSYPGQGSPSGSYPGQGSPTGSHPGQGLPSGSSPSQESQTSKPIDVANNPFLSSALGINKPGGCSGPTSGCGVQPQYPQSQGQYPTVPQGSSCGTQTGGCAGQLLPGSGSGLPQHTGTTPGQPQYNGVPQVQSQYPGSTQGPQQSGAFPGQPQHSGVSPGQPQYPGTPQGKPQNPSTFPGQSQYPVTNQGQPHQPGTQSGQPQYTGAPQGQQQFGASPGQPQYPGSHQGQPQQPGNFPGQSPHSGTSPGQHPDAQQGQPQYLGSPTGLPQYPTASQTPGQQQYPGSPQGKPTHSVLPQGQPQVPGSSSQYPATSSPQSQQPQYPQYGGSNNIPSGSKFPPPFPGASAPSGQLCNQPGYLCITKTACSQGILSKSGVPGRAGICNVATEVCCKIPTSSSQGTQSSPSIGYGNGIKPGTNGIPIGGSIYDKNPSTVYATPASPQQPYTGPLNTTPHPGCPAALKCVPITYCTAEGVMANSQVYLTREQQENRVPLTDCMNPDTNVVGKCCRDPNYKDPWPAGMMMPKGPTGEGFDDGQYHPQDNKTPFDDGQYHPSEQEASDTFSHQAGIYYNVVSTTPKGHTIKKPIGNFNQKPTPFPVKPGAPSSPGRFPAPVYENELPEGSGITSGGLGTPSNDILPPKQGQPGTGYNQIIPSNTASGQPFSPQTSQSSQSTATVSIPGQPTQSGYQPQIPSLFSPSSQTQQPGQVSLSPGYPQGQNTIPIQPDQVTPGKTSTNQFGQPTPGNPVQPGSQLITNQPSGQPGYQPTQPNYSQQPGQLFPGQVTPNFPSNNQYQIPGQGSTLNPSVTTYTPRGHQAGQPNQGFTPGQIAPGSSCGIRHQTFSSNPEEAGITEFPWQALITSAGNKTFLCGAAIISENAVITAAHCVENFRSKDLIVKAGVWKLLSPTEQAEQIRPVKAIARHPEYDAGSLAKDLAVLVFSQSFVPTEHVDKICLPQYAGTRPQSSTYVVTGWGRQALRGPIPNSILHKVDVFFMDNAKCEETLRGTHLGKYFILNKGFSCALPKTSSDLCKVDVGGPVACDRGDGHYELAGVNSWDVGCPAEQTPTVFSNPDAEWIQQILNTPTEKLEQDEEKYNNDKLKGESLDQVDIDQKPGFALGYGK
ncbi:uncharacterized protein LOC142330774 [Lycorma delicatula]|uniref:uncharacterized protein LOC142330774 n=1 Tax=Lycorma delicatula TaxID=130591 RepID=UPI003F51A154